MLERFLVRFDALFSADFAVYFIISSIEMKRVHAQFQPCLNIICLKCGFPPFTLFFYTNKHLLIV